MSIVNLNLDCKVLYKIERKTYNTRKFITMSQSQSNNLTSKFIHKPAANISKKDGTFLKEFLKDFYQKIIDSDDFIIIKNTLREFIINIDKNIETILELMQNHKENENWFS